MGKGSDGRRARMDAEILDDMAAAAGWGGGTGVRCRRLIGFWVAI